MSDLEFQRELSPEQIREALSLLDSAVGGQNQNVRIENLSPAEEVALELEQSSTTMATQDRPPAAEDPQPRKKHLNFAVAYYGIAIAAAGALALLSWSESVLSPRMLGIAQEQYPKQSASQPVQSTSPELPVAEPPRGSGRPPSTPKLAGLSLSPIVYANRDADQTPVRDVVNSDNATAPVARSAANQATGTSQVGWEERVSRKPEHTWWHARALRVAAAKKRFWRRHWQARAEINRGEWCFFACRTWRAQPVFYEPPRNTTQ